MLTTLAALALAVTTSFRHNLWVDGVMLALSLGLAFAFLGAAVFFAGFSAAGSIPAIAPSSTVTTASPRSKGV